MDFEQFLSWLIDNKKLTDRSSKDVISRLKRILKLSNKLDIKDVNYDTFINSNAFLQQSMYVKSQLKRAFVLYLEFGEKK